MNKKNETYTGGEWVEIPATRAFCSLLLTLDKEIQAEIEAWAENETDPQGWTEEPNNLLAALEVVCDSLKLPSSIFDPAGEIAKLQREAEAERQAEGRAQRESDIEDFNRAKGIK